MKSCNVAALGLAGWFLMMPPVTPVTHRAERHAPLSQWKIAGRFPRNKECIAARDRARDAGLAAHPHSELPGRNDNLDEICVRCAAQCVEDNDSHLKPN